MATIVGPTLPDPYYGRVESIREDLVERFGVEEYVNPYPHFTLYALDDDVETAAVETAVRAAVADHDPVPVHTDGVGVFPGNAVWLPVAKSPQLVALHVDVVDAVADLGRAPVPYYRPHRWFPHVGFALGLDDRGASEVVEYLLEYDLEWDLTVDTVTITRPPADGERYERVGSVDL